MMRVILFLACTFSLLAHQAKPIDRAWKLAGDGHADQAIALLQTLVSSNPNDADVRLLLGSLLMQGGAHVEAIAQLMEAVRLRPKSPEAQNALGEAYANAGDFKNAIDPFQKAVALKPDFAIAQMNLGEALLNTDAKTSAARHLDRALELLGRGDDAANAHYLRAKVFADNPNRASADLEQAVAIRPNFPQAWSDLGQARKALLDDNAALKAFERAVAQAPNDPVAQYRLGAEYLDLDKTPAAVEHLEMAYRLAPEDQSTLNALQRALRRVGKVQEADQVKEKLTNLLHGRDVANQNAENSTTLNNEGATLEKTGNLPGALAKYQAALALAPANVPIRVNYAVALLRLGHWSDGLNELHSALLMEPGNAQIQEALKQALAQAPKETIPAWDQR